MIIKPAPLCAALFALLGAGCGDRAGTAHDVDRGAAAATPVRVT